MNDPKQSHNAFDDLLDGDEASTPPKPGLIADGARADLATVRDDTKRAAAHVRERGQQAARQAHERAHAIGASVRRELPGGVAHVRAAVAGQMRAIRWRAVAKPLLIGSAVILVAFAGALYLNAKRIHDLEAQDAQGAPAAIATASAPTKTTNAHGLVATQYRAASPVTATVATVPSVSPAAPAAVPVAPIAPVAQTAVPVASSLPPVPSEANAGTCALALPTLNTLYALVRARSPMEETWIRFGYDCLGRGALIAAGSGFALPPTPVASRLSVVAPIENHEELRRATTTDEPRQARESTTPRVKKQAPVAAPRAVAEVPHAVPVSPAPLPQTQPGTCVLRGVVTTTEGAPMPDAPVSLVGIGGARFETIARTDAAGRFAAEGIPSSVRVRATLRAHGYLDDVRETTNCAPIGLTGKKSNPLSSLFDAARRADRSIKGATGQR